MGKRIYHKLVVQNNSAGSDCTANLTLTPPQVPLRRDRFSSDTEAVNRRRGNNGNKFGSTLAAPRTLTQDTARLT